MPNETSAGLGTRENLKTLFRFPFEGGRWQNNFLIGSALVLVGSMVPIVPTLFVYGYALQVMRQTIAGREPTLPEWTDWGKLGWDGLRWWFISLIYLLPGGVIYSCGFLFYFVSIFTLPFTAESSSEMAVVAPFIFLGGFAVFWVSLFLGMFFMFVGAVPLPAATAQFILKDRFAAAFQFGEWWPLLKANKLGYFIAWVVVFGLGMLVYMIFWLAYASIILICFLPFLIAPFVFYFTVFAGALFGQVYRESQLMADAGEPQPTLNDTSGELPAEV